VLYAAVYGDDGTAASDFAALKSADEANDDFKVMGSVVVSKDAEGKIEVKETGGGQIGGGALLGGAIGAFVGLFAPPFLLATAIGAGIGAITGKLAKNHEENKFGVELDQYMDDNSSAILVVVDNQYLDGVESALGNANERLNKAISKGDYDDIVDALNKGGDEVADAVDS
ncbi:MAG: DUF1269 domain-containing protein, partial [Acidimicrobiia bacterium]